MSCQRWFVMSALLSGVIAGCGRSPISASVDGAAPPIDTAAPDQAVAPDGALPDGPTVADSGPSADAPPCAGTCTDVCKLLVEQCKLYSKGPSSCLKECASVWKAPLTACLAQVACTPDPDCKLAATCISDPPQIDLTIQGLAASAKSDVVTYTFKVCNKGTDPSGLFAVDLYYDRTSAPGLKQMGNQTQYLASLGGGACHSVTLSRTNTPNGTYSSWVQVDAQAAVAETQEGNNVAGPVSVKVISGPPKPDLVIKSLTATVNGMNLDYEAQVCNEGTVGALFFRVDIYYSRALAPSPYMVGDVSAYVLSLGAGACTTVKKSYKNVPVGLYNSWAQVDTLNTVNEANEKNNVAGPRLSLISAPAGCTALCTFASGCGEFKLTEFNLCLTWCKSMSTTQRSCADSAAQAVSCSQLKSCSLPAKPPAPPPPWACLNICSYLVNTCKLVPSNQQLTCVAGCITLPSTKLQCAQTAMNNKQCASMLVCIL